MSVIYTSQNADKYGSSDAGFPGIMGSENSKSIWGIRGYVWLYGNTKPVYVQQTNSYKSREAASSRIDAITTQYERYLRGESKEVLITICNTTFKLETVQAIQLEPKLSY